MAEVRYADLGYAPGRDCIRFGDEVKVMPIDHPNELMNFQWIRVGPVTHIWPGQSGPHFRAGEHVYIPADEDEPLPRQARSLGEMLDLKKLTTEVTQ